jgi:predicted methyltransferase
MTCRNNLLVIPVALAAVALFAGCGGQHGTADHRGDDMKEHGDSVAGIAAPESAPSGAGIDRSILDDPGRPEEEKKQDADRKALDVYAWLGIVPSMTVADLFCGGGYNTHLLSRVVGEGGRVYSVFEFYADKEAFDGQLYKVDEVTARVEKNGLDNVELLIKMDELPADAIDAMVVIRNYHDVEWVFDGLKRKEVVASIFRAMKPGGVVGIVEVATDKDGWDDKTHRLNGKVVIDDFTAGGFKLAGRSDMLANPADDHSIVGFKEGRYTMDRYLLKFEKPV